MNGYPGRHDQRSVLHPHALELSVTEAPCQPLQVEVHHLPDFGQPSRTIARYAETQFVFFLECNECWLRHQMFIDRPECLLQRFLLLATVLASMRSVLSGKVFNTASPNFPL